MKPVVFLGPSLEMETASEVLEASFHPPIRRGDLPRVVDEGAAVIGIIDGVFDQSLPVSVFEIRAALTRGVVLWGSSSMGALRAVECSALGMKGTGWIYDHFLSGELNAEDEVALLFEPWTQKALTVPLVNLRWAGSLQIREGRLTKREVDECISIAQRVPFRLRSEKHLIDVANRSGCGAMCKLLEFLRENPAVADRKRLDALMLLHEFRSMQLK